MHRDVKPANLLIGKNFRISICDFGLSRTLRATSKHRNATNKPKEDSSRQLRSEPLKERKRELSPHIVTRFYRPPEVILLTQDYNENVDLWSCGVTLLEVYTKLILKEKQGHPFGGHHCYPLSPPQTSDS